MASDTRTFEQTIFISAPVAVVDAWITERERMAQWLNPLLRCEPVGVWSTAVGGRFRFCLALPGFQPSLDCVVTERQVGVIQWTFTGFFAGTDRWACTSMGDQTRLVNTFTFRIPNPLVAWGFDLVAAGLTRADMQAQLRRLKRCCEG
ncbi:MAG: SRPBCC family protein [Gloeomargaritaceae cyanobacterium C42_A2020_066]|nr:SRPBCC family protein [Gloeomargaritaceae cyanobacterium C42_A2020_066]